MASSWRRTLGNARSFVSNSMGGLRGGSNLASWVVAGTLAYFLWIKPSQDLKREQEEKAAFAASDPYRYVETRKPVPDPQVTGLIYGNKNKDKSRFKMETINSEAYIMSGYRFSENSTTSVRRECAFVNVEWGNEPICPRSCGDKKFCHPS